MQSATFFPPLSFLLIVKPSLWKRPRIADIWHSWHCSICEATYSVTEIFFPDWVGFTKFHIETACFPPLMWPFTWKLRVLICKICRFFRSWSIEVGQIWAILRKRSAKRVSYWTKTQSVPTVKLEVCHLLFVSFKIYWIKWKHLPFFHYYLTIGHLKWYSM